MASSSAIRREQAECAITPGRGSQKIFWVMACRTSFLTCVSPSPTAAESSPKVISLSTGKACARLKRATACWLTRSFSYIVIFQHLPSRLVYPSPLIFVLGLNGLVKLKDQIYNVHERRLYMEPLRLSPLGQRGICWDALSSQAFIKSLLR